MGCWDCFCAICGGPFFGIEISEELRTAGFLERRAKEIGNQQLERESPRDKVDDAEGDDDDGGCDSHESDDEDGIYDRDVVSAEDVEWARTLHVLAFNPDSEREKKAFVSGPGSYGDYGRVSVESGDDPNAEGADLADASCYDDVESQCGPLFPFHWCCYEMLVKCITGSRNDGSLDKDLLYAIMDSLSPGSGGPLAGLDYGDAGDMQSQFWEVVAGYEYLVSYPRKVPAATDVISSMFSSDAFKTRSSCTDLESLVRGDPFKRIPYDIIYKISGFISDKEVVNLARASWPVHSLLRDNSQFWRQRLRASFLPWFFELQELLEQDQTLLQSNDAQLIFQWAEVMTRPRKWLTGPSMGIANRRRIWSVCEQLGEMYWSQKEEQEGHSIDDGEKLIRRFSDGVPLVIVSSPAPTEVQPVCKVYWANTWSEIQSHTKTLESFWDRHGSLVGISLTPDGQERRLLGLADSDDGIVIESTRLERGEWVEGFLVHIPTPTHLTDSQLMTSPKGLTIILDSGRTSGMGDTSQHHMQRLFSAAPGWYITGMNGTTESVTGNLQLTQLGLVQARRPDVPRYWVQPYQVPLPVPTALGALLWDEDYSHILGRIIQEYPALRLIGGQSLYRTKGYLHNDLICHGALIWAKDVGELRSLRRLTGYVVSGGEADSQYLCGLNVEYEPTADLASRVVGLEKTGAGPGLKPPGVFEPFDIDGPGGEVVTGVGFPVPAYSKALKIHTNQGRTCSWGKTGAQEWDSIKAANGETLVGVVVKFGGLDRRRDDDDEALGHYEMSVVAGLSMALEA